MFHKIKKTQVKLDIVELYPVTLIFILIITETGIELIFWKKSEKRWV